MNQSSSMQESQGRSQGRAQAKTFGYRQPFTLRQIVSQSAWLVLARLHKLAGCDVVRQFHDVIEVTACPVEAHLQDVNHAVVRPRHGLKSSDAVKFAIERPPVFESAGSDDLDRPVRAENIPSQPHLPGAPFPNQPKEIMVRNLKRKRLNRRC